MKKVRLNISIVPPTLSPEPNVELWTGNKRPKGRFKMEKLANMGKLTNTIDMFDFTFCIQF